MQAAVGYAQLDRLDDFVAKRRANFKYLKAGLKQFENIFILPEATAKSDPSWFGFPISMQDNAPFKRDELLVHLNEKKIGTRLLFGGNLLRQPYMKDRPYRVFGETPNSDKVMRDTFWIGVYPGLGNAENDYIIDTIGAFIKNGGKA